MATYKSLFLLGYLYCSLDSGNSNLLAKSESTQWNGLNIVKNIQDRLDLLKIHDKTFERFLNELKERFNAYKEGEIIKAPDQEYIKERMLGMWDNFVNDNLAGRILLVEREDLTFDLKKLHSGVDGFFQPEEIKKMSNVVKNDLKDGMKNLIVGMWTPSVMIVLRAVEGILRKFYVKLTGKNFATDNGNFLNWGPIVQDLEKFKPPIDSELLNDLEYLKNRRNEAQHPEKRFTKDEAESSFFKAKDAIRSMIKSL